MIEAAATSPCFVSVYTSVRTSFEITSAPHATPGSCVPIDPGGSSLALTDKVRAVTKHADGSQFLLRIEVVILLSYSHR